jgi:hypothetical protein
LVFGGSKVIRTSLIILSLLVLFGTIFEKAVVETPLHYTLVSYNKGKGKGKRKDWWNR